nr:reverse transcriptase domain, reverse transcriptase zinc-binding domain protein [Tanacetum cinerariifolium]
MDGLAKISLPVYVANFPCHYRFGNYGAFVERFDRKAVRKNSHTGAKVVNPVDNGDRLQSSNKDTSYANVAKASINLSLLKPWYDDFVVEERLVWLEIEGVPLRAWNNDTFTSIGRKWEESCKDEEGSMGSFIQEQEEEGKIKENDAEIHAATHDDRRGDNVKFDEEHDMASNNSEEIPQRVKDSIVVPQLHELLDSDPFRLESLINKKYGKAFYLKQSRTPEFPLGFLPVLPALKNNQFETKPDALIIKPSGSESINNPTSNNFHKPIGFSLVERLKETIKVRLALGLNMEGCENTLATLIANNGELNVDK